MAKRSTVYTVTVDYNHIRQLHSSYLEVETARKAFDEAVLNFCRYGYRVTLLANTEVLEAFINGPDYEYVERLAQENREIIARKKQEQLYREALEAIFAS